MELTRRAARFAAVAVMLAMIMPLLLAALPSGVSAEEAALLRDVELSRCLPGEDGRQIPMAPGHGDCCVLCAPAAQVAPPPPLVVYTITPAPRAPVLILTERDDGPPPLWPPSRRSAPRAPPFSV